MALDVARRGPGKLGAHNESRKIEDGEAFHRDPLDGQQSNGHNADQDDVDQQVAFDEESDEALHARLVA